MAMPGNPTPEKTILEVTQYFRDYPREQSNKVAKLFGIGKELCRAIRDGTVKELRRKRKERSKLLGAVERPKCGKVRPGDYERCPTCGGKVIMPCVLCANQTVRYGAPLGGDRKPSYGLTTGPLNGTRVR